MSTETSMEDSIHGKAPNLALAEQQSALHEEDLDEAPIDALMSSIREQMVRRAPDSSLEILQSSISELEDSLASFHDVCTDGEEEHVLSSSLQELLASINHLLTSKETFTLNECTSLETEFCRLTEMKQKINESIRQRRHHHVSVSPSHYSPRREKISTNLIQKQRESLHSAFQNALAGTSNRYFALSKKTDKPEDKPNNVSSAASRDDDHVQVPDQITRQSSKQSVMSDMTEWSCLSRMEPSETDRTFKVRSSGGVLADCAPDYDFAPRMPIRRYSNADDY